METYIFYHSSTPLYFWTTRVDTILIWPEYCGQDSTDTTNTTQQQTNTFASEQMVLLQATSPLLISLYLGADTTKIIMLHPWLWMFLHMDGHIILCGLCIKKLTPPIHFRTVRGADTICMASSSNNKTTFFKVGLRKLY